MSSYKEEGFIIRLTKLKEYDSIVDVFSKNRGVLSFYVHNARRPKSTRGQQLEILNLIEFDLPFHSGPQEQQGKLPNISEIKPLSYFPLLKTSSSYFAECFVLAEVLAKLLPKAEKDIELYSMLENAAAYKPADSAFQVAQSALVFLLLKFLQTGGYLSDINTCIYTGAKLDPNKGIEPAPTQIGFVQTETEADPLIIQALKIQKYCLQTQDIAEFLKLQIPTPTIRLLLQTQLDWIESTLEGALKSRSLLQSAIK